MANIGKNANGLNQLSSSLVSLFVSGSEIASFSSQSVNFAGKVSASAVETFVIGTKGPSDYLIFQLRLWEIWTV